VRPDFRPRLNEWVADFALAGQAALDGPDLGFTHGAVPPLLPGARAVIRCAALSRLERVQLGQWTEQIRHRCGKELLGRSMFPPRKYFNRDDCFRNAWGCEGRLKEGASRDGEQQKCANAS